MYSASDQVFDEKFSELEKRWEVLQDSYSIEYSIYEWFMQHKVPIIKSTMLRNV